MPWPLSQDYNEAIQDPRNNLSDAELKSGEAVTNALGIPLPRSGNFADVYEVRCPSGARWAVKCFTREVHGLRERYNEISKYLRQVNLPFMVDFQYLEQGIRVAGRWYPILKMHWVEGYTLNEFVRQYADKPAMLKNLLQIWVRMAARLREAGIAHADLQHGNVLLVPDSTANSLAVKLIDYDGMWVPALAGTPSGEVGHPAYQHPQRLREGTYSPEVDRFSLLVIAVALRGLSVGGRSLWERYDSGDNLLFRQQDFEAPGRSLLFAELLRMNQPEVRDLAATLIDAARMSLDQVPHLADLVPQEKPATPVVPPSQSPAASRTVAATSEPNSFQDSEPEEVTRDTGSSLIAWIAAGSVAACALVGGVLLWALQARSQTAKTPLEPQPQQASADNIVPSKMVVDEDAAPDKPQPQTPDRSITRQVEYPLSSTVRMVFCLIPAGKSRLGSPAGEMKQADHEDEAEHIFSTSAFWLGKHEVTQAEWAAVMGKNPSVHNGRKPGKVTGIDTSRFPVEDVSWEDVQRYIKALNARGGVDDVFGTPGHFVVPTEDEWEYACRGGRGNADPFYFGKVLNGRQANCDGKKPYGTVIPGPSLGRPTVVGSYAGEYPHPWGLCDMHGNVWEFCDSDRSRRARTRVVRGGCWSRAEDCRAANRNFFGPDTNHYENLGLRMCFRPR